MAEWQPPMLEETMSWRAELSLRWVDEVDAWPVIVARCVDLYSGLAGPPLEAPPLKSVEAVGCLRPQWPNDFCDF